MCSSSNSNGTGSTSSPSHLGLLAGCVPWGTGLGAAAEKADLAGHGACGRSGPPRLVLGLQRRGEGVLPRCVARLRQDGGAVVPAGGGGVAGDGDGDVGAAWGAGRAHVFEPGRAASATCQGITIREVCPAVARGGGGRVAASTVPARAAPAASGVGGAAGAAAAILRRRRPPPVCSPHNSVGCNAVQCMQPVVDSSGCGGGAQQQRALTYIPSQLPHPAPRSSPTPGL